MDFSRSSSPLSRRLSFLEKKLAALSAEWQANFLMEGNSLLGLRPGKGTSIGLSFINDLSGWQQGLQDTASITPVEEEGGAFEFSALRTGFVGVASLSTADALTSAIGPGGRLFTPSNGFYVAFRFRNVSPTPPNDTGCTVGGQSDQGGFQLIYVGPDAATGSANMVLQVLGPGGFVFVDLGVPIDTVVHDVEMWSPDGVKVSVRIDGQLLGPFSPTALPNVPLSPILQVFSQNLAIAQVTRFFEFLAIGRVGS